MRLLFAAVVGLCLIATSARAWWHSVAQVSIAAGGGACAEYTTWLAATSGTSALEKSTAQTLICGLVSDGVWAQLDYFYWFPTNTTTTAAINMVTPGSFNLSISGTCTFTADTGWAGDGLTCVGDTGYTPSTSGRVTQNSVSAGVYITAGTTGYIYGVNNTAGTAGVAFQPGAAATVALNSTGALTGNTTVAGDWVTSRDTSGTPASNFVVELNGTAISGSPFADATNATIANQHVVVWAIKVAGGSNVVLSNETIISHWLGLNLTGAQRTAMHSRLNAACTAMSIGTC